MKFNRTVLLLTITSLSLFSGLSRASETVYKWKDARGMVHYSSKVPAGTDYEVVKKNLKKKAVNNSAKKTEKKLLDEAKTRQDSAAQKEKTAAYKKEMAAYCTSLKDRLAAIQSGQLIKVKNASGDSQYMSDIAREQETKSLNQKISADCAS